MVSKLKNLILVSSAVLMCGFAAPAYLRANPAENVGPDQNLYQRVKNLADAGLLDAGDRAVLDEGRIVTRLELAFYVEKAKRHLEDAGQAESAPAATQANPVKPAPKVKTETAASPTVVPAKAVAPVATPVPTAAPPAASNEIDSLLKELEEETAQIRAGFGRDDYRLQQQAEEMDKLKSVQDEVDSAFRKSNKSNSNPHFTSKADTRIENLNLSGITQVSIMEIKNELNVGINSDLGGVGSAVLNLGGALYDSGASAAPASMYISSATLQFNMDGKLGHWNCNAVVKGYNSDTDLGDFTRGGTSDNRRFETPFEIKKYSDDKNMKVWDDYMTNLSYVPSYSSFTNQNNTQRVFNGLYMIGTQLPLVSRDAKASILVGPVDQNWRWEEALKYSQPWGNGFLQTSISADWVNESFGINAPTTLSTGPVTNARMPVMDLKSYAMDMGWDLKPFFFDIEGGFSSLYTGIVNNSVTNLQPDLKRGAQALEAGAGQASLNYYPLTLYYSVISEYYANHMSKVFPTGIQYWKFGYFNGYPNAPNVNSVLMNDRFGLLGMADDLISNRQGWRVNLGWKGRQQDWMRNWPGFLDDILVNFDVAQQNENRVVLDEQGYNVTEAYNLLSVYYPEDTGIWGNSVWHGYGTMHNAGQAYVDNLQRIRNDSNWSGTATTTNTFVVREGPGGAERVPFLLLSDAVGNPLPVGSKPVTDSSGRNRYNNLLTELKTFTYITLTTKLQLNKMLKIDNPFYCGLFFTDNHISGATADPVLSKTPDPNRPGQTLSSIPNLFDQTVYDASFMYQLVKNLNLMTDYGLELWKSDYSYPRVDYRTDSLGAGLAYDFPWGGGKLEVRYKRLIFQDAYVPASNYQANQFYSYLNLVF